MKYTLVQLALLAVALLALMSCKTVKVVEKVNYRDSVVTVYHHDTTHITITDTTHIEQHVQLTDSSSLIIQFGAGGGTYNAKTGEATNVTGVQHTETHKEDRDSIASLKHQLELAQATNDSLSTQVTTYQHEYEKESQAKKRSGYARFTSWWFWITAILLLCCVAFWVCDKIPACKPYTTMIKMFLKL